MDEPAYAEMYELEDAHWWFRGRRAVIRALLHRAALPPRPRLLDAGCGTGRNLVELSGLGPASGVDPSASAVDFCRARGLDHVQQAGLEALPFQDRQFDLLLACDVIEHVDHDVAALRELLRVAAPGGTLLLTVPAYQWLWTDHDVQLHHRRRYTLGTLESQAEAAGWRPTFGTYFNTLLLPAVAPMRMASRWRSRTAPHRGRRGGRGGHTDLDRTPAALNGALGLPMRLEAAMIARGARLPAGVSAALLCRAGSSA
ncbi:MAG: class I SAM-dependent methyltransferase [Acidimicrobiales bacterium]